MVGISRRLLALALVAALTLVNVHAAVLHVHASADHAIDTHRHGPASHHHHVDHHSSDTTRVSAIVSRLVTSGSRDRAAHDANEGAIFVRMGKLSRGSYSLRLGSIQRVKPPRGSEDARTRLEAGDILISITGEVGLLGLIPAGTQKQFSINGYHGILSSGSSSR